VKTWWITKQSYTMHKATSLLSVNYVCTRNYTEEPFCPSSTFFPASASPRNNGPPSSIAFVVEKKRKSCALSPCGIGNLWRYMLRIVTGGLIYHCRQNWIYTAPPRMFLLPSPVTIQSIRVLHYRDTFLLAITIRIYTPNEIIVAE